MLKKVLRFFKFFRRFFAAIFLLLALYSGILYKDESFQRTAYLAFLGAISQLGVIWIYTTLLSSIFFSFRRSYTIKEVLYSGILISVCGLVFGYIAIDTIVPRMKKELHEKRYDSYMLEKGNIIDPEQRAEMFSSDPNNFTLPQLEQKIDSIKKVKTKLLTDVKREASKLPDSILNKNFKKEIKRLNLRGSDVKSYERKNRYKLRTSIMEYISERNTLSTYEKVKFTRWITLVMIVFVTFFGLFLGTYFKDQHWISLICIGIVAFNLNYYFLEILVFYCVGDLSLLGILLYGVFLIGVLILTIFKVSKANSSKPIL